MSFQLVDDHTHLLKIRGFIILNLTILYEYLTSSGF